MAYLFSLFLITLSLSLFAGDSKNNISASNKASEEPQYISSTGKKIYLQSKTLAHKKKMIWSIAWHPKGTQYASASNDERICIWDAKTHQAITTSTTPSSNPFSVDYSHDGDLIVSGTQKQFLRIWKPLYNRTEASWHAHSHRIYRAIFNRNSSLLASCGDERDHTVKIWDTIDLKVTKHIKTTETPTDLRWFDDNVLLFTEYGGSIKFLDKRSKEEITAIEKCEIMHIGGQQVTATPDGMTVLYNNSDSIQSFDRRKLKSSQKFIVADRNSFYQSVDLNPETNTIVTASIDQNSYGTISLYRPNGELIDSITALERLQKASLSPDGSKILAAALSGSLYMWQQSPKDLASQSSVTPSSPLADPN
jgi:WD40 repeat protein